MIKHWRSLSLVLLALAVVGGVLWQGYTASAAPSSAALSIAPRKDYTVKSGESVKDTILIRNLDDTKPLDLTIRVIDFTYNDESGTPKLFLDKNAPQTPWSLRSFMTVPGKVTIEPGASARIPVSVTIPSEVKAGSYYSAIIYSAGAEDYEDATNVGLSASGTTLAFVSVPGKVEEKLELQKFGAFREATADKEGGYAFFHFRSPKQIAYTLKNSGNVAESPTGTITLRDLFGNEYMIKDINPAGSLALIGQTRIFKACIKKNIEDVNFQGAKSQANSCASSQLWPGYYRATLAGFYGWNGNVTQEIHAKASFWYLPTWFILTVIVVLFVVGYVIWNIVDRTRTRMGRKKKR